MRAITCLKKPIWTILGMIALLGASSLSLVAAVGDKIGGNVPVGDGAHLTSFSSTQAVFTLINGNLVILWQDQGTVDGDLGGVFGKVFAPDGTVVKGTFNLDSSSTGNQVFPKGAALTGGGFAVTWRNSQTSSVTSITNSFARVFDGAGTAVSSPVQINSSASNADLLFKADEVVPLSNGNFFVVLNQDERGALANEDDDYIQIFGANGAKIGGNVPVGDGAHLTSFSSTQAVFTLTNGNLVILWQDQGTVDGDLGGVFGKVFAPDGSVVKGTFNLDSSSTGNQVFPKGAALTGGGFAVTWRNSQTSSVTSITNSFARVFDGAGTAVSSPVQINSSASNADLLFKADEVVPLSNGNFFVVLNQDERGALANEDDDYVQLFGANGAKIGGNVPVGDGAHLTSFSSTQAVFTLTNGNLVILWQDQGTVDGDLGGVFGKVFATDGSVVKGTFNLDSSSTGNQVFPKGAALTGGGFAVTWRNSATSSVTSITNSFARVFDGAGTAVSSPVQINSTASNVDLLFKASDVVPLSTGNFFVVLNQDERGALANEDDDFIQLFEGPPVGPPPAPEIGVTETAAGNVADGGSFGFGTTTVGTPVTKTFTVTNSGTATLNLSALSVPSGFTIAQNFGSATVASSGGTTTFQITMSAGAVATPSGTLTFTNDDADENPYNFTVSGTVNPAPIAVSSLNRVNATPTNAATVNWTLTFASAVTGVTASNFSLSGAAAAGLSVGTPNTGSGGLTWNIPVTTGAADGTLTLILANSTGLSAPISNAPFTGQSYTIDKTPPMVVSVTRLAPSGQATNATTVTFRVTYSEPVNINAPATSRYQVVSVNGSDIVGTVSSVTGAGAIRDVTVDLISGTGEFRLRVLD